MARVPRPWFWKQTGWWVAYIGGAKNKLAQGRENKKAARTKLNELLSVAVVNGDETTVAAVIERYLAAVGDELAANTIELRKPYLQSFADLHGWRRIEDCLAEGASGMAKRLDEKRRDTKRPGGLQSGSRRRAADSPKSLPRSHAPSRRSAPAAYR